MKMNSQTASILTHQEKRWEWKSRNIYRDYSELQSCNTPTYNTGKSQYRRFYPVFRWLEGIRWSRRCMNRQALSSQPWQKWILTWKWNSHQRDWELLEFHKAQIEQVQRCESKLSPPPQRMWMEIYQRKLWTWAGTYYND